MQSALQLHHGSYLGMLQQQSSTALSPASQQRTAPATPDMAKRAEPVLAQTSNTSSFVAIRRLDAAVAVKPVRPAWDAVQWSPTRELIASPQLEIQRVLKPSLARGNSSQQLTAPQLLLSACRTVCQSIGPGEQQVWRQQQQPQQQQQHLAWTKLSTTLQQASTAAALPRNAQQVQPAMQQLLLLHQQHSFQQPARQLKQQPVLEATAPQLQHWSRKLLPQQQHQQRLQPLQQQAPISDREYLPMSARGGNMPLSNVVPNATTGHGSIEESSRGSSSSGSSGDGSNDSSSSRSSGSSPTTPGWPQQQPYSQMNWQHDSNAVASL